MRKIGRKLKGVQRLTIQFTLENGFTDMVDENGLTAYGEQIVLDALTKAGGRLVSMQSSVSFEPPQKQQKEEEAKEEPEK